MNKTPNIQHVAAKALIVNKDGYVLVLKQSDPTITGYNQYHPPGGILEPGETLHECLMREVKEEIGVDAQLVKLFDTAEWRSERGDDVMQFVALFYICTISDESFTIQKSEASEALWVGLDTIDSLDIMEPSKTVIKKFLSTNYESQ